MRSSLRFRSVEEATILELLDAIFGRLHSVISHYSMFVKQTLVAWVLVRDDNRHGLSDIYEESLTKR